MKKCPKCGSTRLVTYLSLDAPVVCLDCGHRVESDGAANSALMQQAIQSSLQQKEELPSLKEQMIPLQKQERKRKGSKK